jgi:type II secretory pathway pseudopilin PulG
MTRARQDVGETLVEVLLTVVIVGLTFTALISSLGMAGNAGNSQRQSVQADVVMRNYAEATKIAVQSCVLGGTYAVTYPLPLPVGFSVSTEPGADERLAVGSCPPVGTTQVLTLRVKMALGGSVSMNIRVRTP